MEVQGTAPRPREVTVALLLIGASWAATMIYLPWRMFVSPLPVDGQRPPVAASLTIVVIVLVVSGGLLAALVYRRRWAYIAWLALFALSVVGTLPGLASAPGTVVDQPLGSALYFVTLAAEVTGVVYLLRRSSREWYGISRPPAAAGEWRADPGGAHQFRWWDGSGWSEHVADDGRVAVDPPPEAQG